MTSEALPGERGLGLMTDQSCYAVRVDCVIIRLLTWGKAELPSLDSHTTLNTESLERSNLGLSSIQTVRDSEFTPSYGNPA